MAQSFEDFMLKITCAKMAHDALAYSAQQDTPVHPSWRAVNAVLAGVGMVHIDRKGYLLVVEKS